MSDSTTLERAEGEVVESTSTVAQEMVEGTATISQNENDEFQENSAITTDSITVMRRELSQLKISSPEELQKMEFSELQDSATDDKEEKKMLQKLKLELAALKANQESATRQRIRDECEELRREIAKIKEDSTDERTITRNNNRKYAPECSETADAETDERMRKELLLLKEKLKETKQKEQQEMLQTLRNELAELKKAKQETEKREKARKEREELKRKIEKLKKENEDTTTRERKEFEKLKKEVKELEEAATRSRTKDQFEELRKHKAKLEESATKVRTKTKVAQLETEIRAEEARSREINRILQLMAAAQAVDLCFLVDCTGSMSSYIQGVKEKIQSIIEKSKKMLPDLNFSVAFVGYRDHCDGADRTVVLDFTTSILEFQSFMGSVAAKGGGDAPEDVFGGIEEVTKLSWSKQTRMLFHIADSPCHGTRFHDPSVYDDYPNGDPRGLQIEYLLPKLEGFKVIYWFAKLGNMTDLMIQAFQSIMKINQIDLASVDVDGLVEAVAGSVSASVNIYEHDILEEVVRENVKGEVVSYRLFNGQPDWSVLEIKNVTVWKNKIPFDLSNIRKPLEVLCEPKRSLKIASDPFAKGASRLAYYGRDCTSGEDKGNILVLKQFLYTGENRLDLYKEQMEVQSVAVALANKFNRVKPAGTKDVHFAEVSTVTITDGEKQNHFAMERYITGKYVKFNNNAGFVNETAYTATLNAFSHWTYWATGRYLMVVDLQGVKDESSGEVRYVLTDPAVHCGTLRRFGKTNLGRDGMYKFFRTHYCNGICKAMALKFHRCQPAEVYTDFAGATVIT